MDSKVNGLSSISFLDNNSPFKIVLLEDVPERPKFAPSDSEGNPSGGRHTSYVGGTQLGPRISIE
jgi:hypothetical protein